MSHTAVSAWLHRDKAKGYVSRGQVCMARCAWPHRDKATGFMGG